jgi:hypothetical protein
VLARALRPRAAGLLSLDELCALMLVRADRIEPAAVPAVRLLDALWHRDFDDLATQSLRVRRELLALETGHDLVRLRAGMLINDCEPIVARTHGVSVARFRAAVRAAANDAKRTHRFPWHLLDG